MQRKLTEEELINYRDTARPGGGYGAFNFQDAFKDSFKDPQEYSKYKKSTASNKEWKFYQKMELKDINYFLTTTEPLPLPKQLTPQKSAPTTAVFSPMPTTPRTQQFNFKLPISKLLDTIVEILNREGDMGSLDTFIALRNILTQMNSEYSSHLVQTGVIQPATVANLEFIDLANMHPQDFTDLQKGMNLWVRNAKQEVEQQFDKEKYQTDLNKILGLMSPLLEPYNNPQDPDQARKERRAKRLEEIKQKQKEANRRQSNVFKDLNTQMASAIEDARRLSEARRMSQETPQEDIPDYSTPTKANIDISAIVGAFNQPTNQLPVGELHTPNEGDESFRSANSEDFGTPQPQTRIGGNTITRDNQSFSPKILERDISTSRRMTSYANPQQEQDALQQFKEKYGIDDIITLQQMYAMKDTFKQVPALEIKLAQQKSLIANLSGSNDQLARDVQRLTQESSQNLTDARKFRDEANLLRNRVRTVEDERDNYQAKEKKCEDEKQNLKIEMAKMQGIIDALKLDLQKLRDENNRLKEENDRLRQQSQGQVDQDIERLNTTLRNVQQQLIDTRAKVTEKELENKENYKRYNDSVDEFQNYIKELKDEIDNINDRLQNETSRADDFETRANRSEQLFQELQATIETQTIENKNPGEDMSGSGSASRSRQIGSSEQAESSTGSQGYLNPFYARDQRREQEINKLKHQQTILRRKSKTAPTRAQQVKAAAEYIQLEKEIQNLQHKARVSTQLNTSYRGYADRNPRLRNILQNDPNDPVGEDPEQQFVKNPDAYQNLIEEQGFNPTYVVGKPIFDNVKVNRTEQFVQELNFIIYQIAGRKDNTQPARGALNQFELSNNIAFTNGIDVETEVLPYMLNIKLADITSNVAVARKILTYAFGDTEQAFTNFDKLRSTIKYAEKIGAFPFVYIPVAENRGEAKLKNVATLPLSKTDGKVVSSDFGTIIIPGQSNVTMKREGLNFVVYSGGKKRTFGSAQDANYFISSGGFGRKSYGPVTERVFGTPTKNLSQAIY